MSRETRTITECGAMIFSRLERARIESEIRRQVMLTWAYWCASGALLLVVALTLRWLIAEGWL